jgi:glucose-1-phosphate thymidylyltransferase
VPADLVGVIPAAGLASRLGPIPCSKEIYPVAHRQADSGSPGPVTACEFLIHKFRNAGASRIFIVLREGKWDIPAYLGSGHRFGVDIAYLMMRFPFGQPFTVDAAHPFVRGATVLFGFPDIVFEYGDAFLPLLERQQAARADVVLGLFPVRRPEKMDLVQIDGEGMVTDLVIKPTQTDLTHTWLIAAWSPTFTDFLHGHVARCVRDNAVTHPSGRELYLGDVLIAALGEGLSIHTVSLGDTDYVDIGTPDDLSDAMTRRLEHPG